MEMLLLGLCAASLALHIRQYLNNCTSLIELDEVHMHLYSLNRIAYRDIIDEYSSITKTYVVYDNRTVSFIPRVYGSETERIEYHNLSERLKNLKKLKDKLYDNTCAGKLYISDGSDNVSIQVGGTITSNQLPPKKKPRKKKWALK